MPDDAIGPLFLFGHRHGRTYDPKKDLERLNKQSADVFRLMLDGRWRSLREISHATGHPESSVSARLRDFRKPQFGGFVVERKRETEGLHLYRLALEKDGSPRRVEQEAEAQAHG